jgi:hypothetical protein
MRPLRCPRAGFSAFELGLCFLAIGIGSFIIATYGRFAISRARDSCCGSNLRQLALAMQMYCADNGGRGPVGDDAPSAVNVYTKNLQLFTCPSNLAAQKRMLRLPAGSDSVEGGASGTPQEVAIGYEFRLGVWNDEPPTTLIVQDIAPDVHTSRTWQAARLDGAVARRPAGEWKGMEGGRRASGGGELPLPKPEARSR